jgi:hypothetical protein
MSVFDVKNLEEKVASMISVEFGADCLVMGEQRQPWDIEVTVGGKAHRVEVKNDKKADKTGNLFVEFKDARRDCCGLALSVEAGVDTLAVVLERSITLYHLKSLFEHASSGKYRSIRTEQGVNGNSPGHWAVGYIVPIKDVEQFSIIRWEY